MVHCRRLSLAVALTAGVAFASPPAGGPGGFSRRLWQTQDGLPEETVQAFAQTPDHYLWIGTSGGLVRFDGDQLVVFDRENTPELHENSVFALAVGHDGALWIGTDGGGVVRYRDRRFRAFSSRDGLANPFVRSVVEDSRGAVWVGTDDGLYRIEGERVSRVDGTPRVPALAVHAILEDRHGRMWVGGSTLLLLDGAQACEYRLPGERGANRIKSLLETRDGTIWVGTVSGVQRSIGSAGDGARPVGFTKLGGLVATVRVMREDREGTLWLGTIGNGIVRRAGGRTSVLTAPATLPSNTVLALFTDAGQNIWIGTQTGMLRLSQTALSTLSLAGSADSDFSTISPDADGTLWVASTFLYRIQGRETRRYEFGDPLRGVHVRNLLRSRSGALWVGTDGDGIFRMKSETVTRFSTREGLSNNFIRAILEARDGSIWIGTDEGLSRWREDGLKSWSERDGLVYFSIRTLLEDRGGDLWVGTERGLSHMHGEKFIEDALTARLREEKVWALHEDPAGGLWIGTRGGGLFLWKQGRLAQLSMQQGLASNSIYHILEDRRGRLWMSGPNGISSVARGALERVAQDPAQRPAVTLYGISDGMATTQMHGGTQPAGVLTASGEIWFPSNKGPVRIVPDVALTARTPPPAVIERVVADGRAIDASGQLELPPGSGKLELRYGAIRLSSQERVRFRYKLEGFDPEWTDAHRRRSAYYTNLPPGKYRFRVVAFDMGEPGKTTEAALDIDWRPHFYQTAWFFVLAALALLGAAGAAYRAHLLNLRARFHAVLEERGRLAREMHDTLIQGCTGISALLEAASSVREVAPESHQELVEQARIQVRRTIEEARRAVWNLRHSTSPQNALGAKLAEVARQFGREHDIPLYCDIQPAAAPVDERLEEELLLVAREALTNAVRHAQAHHIHVRLWFSAKRVHLLIADDGCGFDPAAVGEDHMHYGLVGMRERMEHVGGRFLVESRAGHGTKIEVEAALQARRKTAEKRVQG